MLKRERPAQGLTATGRAAQSEMRATNTRSHYTMATGFFNERGRPVGQLIDGWLTKHVVTEKHQLREPRSWCSDREHLEKLEAVGGRGLHLIDEQGRHWWGTLKAFALHGLTFDRGFGPQVALPLKFWRVEQPGARQLLLFEEETL